MQIWNDSGSGKRCNFHIESASGERENNLVGAAGCGVRVCWSDHARIMLGVGRALEMTFHLFSPNFSADFGRSFFVAGRRSIW